MLKTPKFWYQNRISFFSILLLPISLIWIVGTFLKKRFAKPIRSKIPVIAVGSAIIGGSGKTPSVIYVCEILEKMGYRPHIISKGYGGSANEVIKVSPEMNYSLVGDEAIMMSKYYHMENIKVVEATTEAGFKKNSFIYNFMSSMRQKINDPLGVRAKKRKEISQR